MMEKGTIKITGKREGMRVRGTEMRVTVKDKQGKETLLPALSVEVRCIGRKEYVTATVVLHVSEIDVELPISAVDMVARDTRVSDLEAEVETLRHYGNKDCTAQADECLEDRRVLTKLNSRSDNLRGESPRFMAGDNDAA